MKQTFKKLLFGRQEENIKLDHTSLVNQRENFKRVWNNEKHNDIGLEKMLRLFLVAIQFAFPGIYIRDKVGSRGLTWKNLAVEAYVAFKTILPLLFLLTGIYTNIFIVLITSYLLCETILYVATLIFVSDIFAKPRSYRRSVLLLYFNYLEIVFAFAVIYGGLHLLNEKATSVIDFLYFSFVTSATIGYGDIYPVTDLGKIIVSFQSIVFLVFIVLFLNFFSSKVEDKDFFDKGENSKE
ncbi:MAG: potassium channel family protein [Bacteroidota bacterium]|nr:potassium channel family protein [Bacteroidota bacterium]